jgi:hypothetical protein
MYNLASENKQGDKGFSRTPKVLLGAHIKRNHHLTAEELSEKTKKYS